MKIRAYSWFGVRTTNFDETMRFFGEVLGLRLAETTATAANFQLPSGQQFEVFSPDSLYYPLHSCPVLAFEVEDVLAARSELEAAGVEFVSDVAGSAKGELWTYFRGPDGVLYELMEPAKEQP